MNDKSSTPQDVNSNSPPTKNDFIRNFSDWVMLNALWVILVPFGITLLIYLEAILRLGPPPDIIVLSRGVDDLFYQTFVLVVVIMAWLMKSLSQQRNSALQRLLAQKVISEIKGGETQDIVLVFRRWSKHWIQYLLNAIFVIIGLWFNYAIIYGKEINRLLPGNEPTFVGVYAPEVWLSNLVTSIGSLLALFLVGNWIFEIIITARIINHAPKYFDLEIQPSHPDKSGGLKTVGDLCLKMVYIVLIPTIFISFSLASEYFPPDMQASVPAYLLTDNFQALGRVVLVVLGASGIFVFFWPMFTVHRRMLDEHVELGIVKDNIAQRILILNRKLMLDPAAIATEDKRKQTLSDIESLIELHQYFHKTPVWPFDRSVLIKFITTQTVPIISLLSLSSSQLGEFLEIILG